jgi:type II secretory pathway pseudopilin PulG
MSRRPGFTMAGLVAVIGILTVMLGLLLPAVQRVRETGLKVQSQNNLRQIALATHHYAANNGNLLPTNRFSGGVGNSIFSFLLPYIDQDDRAAGLKTFISPADPTTGTPNAPPGLCSYPANSQAFQDGTRLPQSFTDGTATTLLFAEHYGVCNDLNFVWYLTLELTVFTTRTSTFADGVYPNSRLTFQVMPCTKPKEACFWREPCNWNLAQTPHRGGMLAALADGSVRTLSPGMSPKTYWGAVTPAGGEVPGDDW